MTVQTIEVEDDWRTDMRGMPGEECMLQLLLRLVADVGLVGLPNAGKSALLAALSKARPEIASYPFTTLVPNLGVMGREGDPVLVDLPGLIEGAHIGRGLGRNFLRHVRRTRILLHVVDVSLSEPASDYETIREELRMYNPEYCTRPHLIALNKIDLVTPAERLEEIRLSIQRTAEERREIHSGGSLPDHMIYTSALTGEGVDELQRALHDMLGTSEKDERFEWDSEAPYSQNLSFDANWTWDD